MENVVPGNSILVTFGMPFTRSSIDESDLVTIRALTDNDVEIQAFVDQLSPWRHISNEEINGKSVRIAMIQFNYSFSVAFPDYETITVEWGLQERKKN